MAGIRRPNVGKFIEFCTNCGYGITPVLTTDPEGRTWYHLPAMPYMDAQYKRECESGVEGSVATPPVSDAETEKHLRELDDLDELLG